MSDTFIAETMSSIDGALARIAISIAGGRHQAQDLMLAVSRGDQTPTVAAFVNETGALIRARILLANAYRDREPIAALA